MTKAKHCKFCKSDRLLAWKRWDQTVHWITCEGCGQVGPAKETQPEAGDAWNEQQTPHVPVYG